MRAEQDEAERLVLVCAKTLTEGSSPSHKYPPTTGEALHGGASAWSVASPFL